MHGRVPLGKILNSDAFTGCEYWIENTLTLFLLTCPVYPASGNHELDKGKKMDGWILVTSSEGFFFMGVKTYTYIKPEML